MSGPIVAPWIQSYRLVREAFVLSVTCLFLFSGAAQLLILAADGQYDRARTLATLAALVPAVGLIPVGTRLRDRLSSEAFDAAVLGLLGLSAIALLIRSA